MKSNKGCGLGLRPTTNIHNFGQLSSPILLTFFSRYERTLYYLSYFTSQCQKPTRKLVTGSHSRTPAGNKSAFQIVKGSIQTFFRLQRSEPIQNLELTMDWIPYVVQSDPANGNSSVTQNLFHNRGFSKKRVFSITGVSICGV